MPYSEDHKTAIFIEHEFRIGYVFLPGQAPLPVAYQTGGVQNNLPFEVVRTARPGWFRVVTFNLTRLRLKPLVPDRTAAVGETLVYASLFFSDPAELSNGVRGYNVSGCYIYSLDGTPDTNGWKWPTGYLLQPTGGDLTDPVIGPRP